MGLGYGYRFGFNGKENLNEISGSTGTHLDFGARVYDSRLGRFLSVDNFAGNFPWQSPFLFASNTPIIAIDNNGDSTLFYSLTNKIFYLVPDNMPNRVVTIADENKFLSDYYSMPKVLNSDAISDYLYKGQIKDGKKPDTNNDYNEIFTFKKEVEFTKNFLNQDARLGYNIEGKYPDYSVIELQEANWKIESDNNFNKYENSNEAVLNKESELSAASKNDDPESIYEKCVPSEAKFVLKFFPSAESHVKMMIRIQKLPIHEQAFIGAWMEHYR
ncbi:MAG: hypothetical protein JXR58_02900 [Bacteroidales bacterium]|nr:hypothetical protein [Bacteroidales bacterium]